MTVDSQYTSVVLTREDGFIPLKTYDFQVRASWNAGHCKGKWSKVSKYVGKFIYYSTNSVLLVIEIHTGSKYCMLITFWRSRSGTELIL